MSLFLGAAQGPQTHPQLWPAVWMLLRLRLRILVSGLRRAKLRRKIGYTIAAIAVLAIIGFFSFLFWAFLNFLRRPEVADLAGDLTPFLETMPVLIVGGAFLGVLVTSFGVLLQVMYLSGDMDFLLSAPVPIRAVFIAKLIQAIVPNFSLICLFALPALYTLGISSGFNLLYYPMVLLVLSALALAAAGLASLLVMAVVRLFPARRVAEVLAFVGATFSFLCSQIGNLSNMSDRSVTGQQAAEALQTLARFNTPWSPLTWAGRSLVDLGAGRWLSAGLFLVLTLGLSGLAFMVALTTAERLYYSGWASMQGVVRKKKTARANGQGQLNGAMRRTGLEKYIPAPVRAIVVKDFYVLRRDVRNMSQLVMPLIFGLVYAVMFLRTGGEVPEGQGNAPPMFYQLFESAMLYGNVAIALFVSWFLLARLANVGFSQEGRSYWLIKTAPVNVRRLLFSKFLVAFLPSIGLALLFLIGISIVQGSGLALMWFTVPVVLLSVAGNAGLNLAFGVLGAKMDWEDPRQMNQGTGSCLGGLASMLFLPLILLLFFGPPIAAGIFSWSVFLAQLVGLFLGGLLGLAAAILPLWLVRERVLRLGEQ